MLEAEWNAERGWGPPKIKAFGEIVLHPAATVLHYGLAVFEGMKAYRCTDDRVLLFRPKMNMKRLCNSCKRMSLPTMDEHEMLLCIEALVKLDIDHVPRMPGCSLYIRPTVISTQPTLGVAVPSNAKAFVIMSPVGPYFDRVKAITLMGVLSYTRAWKGSAGDTKAASNYGPAILGNAEAVKAGFDMSLWLVVENDDYLVTECGAMNVFVKWINDAGELEVITPPVKDNLILPGVTRASVLTLVKEIHPEIKVSEVPVYMRAGVMRAAKEKRLQEVFVCGTAASVVSVKKIGFENEEITVPLDPTDTQKEIGPLAREILNMLNAIKNGTVSRPEWQYFIT
eukprot:Filipodium_phascolosomae@DN204_c0_g1_i1.p1